MAVESKSHTSRIVIVTTALTTLIPFVLFIFLYVYFHIHFPPLIFFCFYNLRGRQSYQTESRRRRRNGCMQSDIFRGRTLHILVIEPEMLQVCNTAHICRRAGIKGKGSPVPNTS